MLRGLKSQNQENPTEFRRHRLPLPVWPPGSCAWQLQSPGEFIAGLGASGDGVLRIISTFRHLSGWSYIFCCMAQNARKSAAGTQPVGFVGMFSEGLMWGGSGVHCRAVEVRSASWCCVLRLWRNIAQNGFICDAQFPSKCRPEGALNF